MYTIELNITGISDGLVKAMFIIGKNNQFDVFHHGYDRLVFTSDDGPYFTNLINELAWVCKVYGVDYVSLLV